MVSVVGSDHGSPRAAETVFGLVLRAVRLAPPNGHGPAISMSDLARRIDAHPSTISRLESGSRVPSRPMVLRLAAALEASDDDRDRLLASAGYAVIDGSPRPGGLPGTALLGTDPAVTLLASYLADTTIADDERERVRQVVTLLCAGLRDRHLQTLNTD